MGMPAQKRGLLCSVPANFGYPTGKTNFHRAVGIALANRRDCSGHRASAARQGHSHAAFPNLHVYNVAFLRSHPQVTWVNYPGLADHEQHALAAKQFRTVDGAPGASGLLAFGVKPASAGAGAGAGAAILAGTRFIEAAQFMSHVANIGDTRTLVIHPASTTHRQLDDAQQLAAGVRPDMVRMSVGIEHIDDILWDIDQALHQAVHQDPTRP